MRDEQSELEQRGRHRVDQNVLRTIDAASAVARQSPDGVKRPCLSQCQAPRLSLSNRDRPATLLLKPQCCKNFGQERIAAPGAHAQA